jgi:hypothetical protein
MTRTLASGVLPSISYVAHVPAPPDGTLWVRSDTGLPDKFLGMAYCHQRLECPMEPFWPLYSKRPFGAPVEMLLPSQYLMVKEENEDALGTCVFS